MKMKPSLQSGSKSKRRERKRSSSGIIISFAACRHVLWMVQSVLLAVVCSVYAIQVAATVDFLMMDGELLKELHVYVNWHKTPAVGGPYEQLWEPRNSDQANRHIPAGQYTQDQDYATGLQALKRIVEQAGRDAKRVRAYGSRWSTTDISYTNQYLIDTYGLNYVKVGVDNPARHVTATYRDRSHLLTFTQSGVMVKHCYQALVDKGLTLKTSGLDDGQTMAGAISTGTHNAAIHIGSMQDTVKGIHLVLLNETVFLQRASDPVVTDLYRNEIGADRIWSDDDLFAAALVNFGTFGIIHGFLIITEPLFRLDVEVKAMPCAEANEAFYALDPTLVGMNMDNPFPNTRPWHFESYINPYRLTSPDGCMLRVMNKVRLDEDEIQSIAGIEGGFQPVYMALDPHALMARAYSSILSLQFLLRGGGDRFWNFPFVRTLQKVAYGLVNSAVVDMIFQASEAESNGYPLELYGSANSDSYFAQYPQSTITMEVAVPLEHLHEALPLVLKVLNDNPSATQIDLRYVKSTNATLGFTRHSDVTALIDFPSAYTPTTLATYRLIQEALEEHRDTISFTYHWGKFLPENAEWVHKSYGAALEQWQKQRERLLTTPLERHIFSSDFIESLGI